ncbi:hypothetical protein L7F22_041821 [Adiantum nelumboides]|nr:hypothetical protein [Adiantum nelumboides]
MASLVPGRDEEEVKLRAFPLVLREEAKVWFQGLEQRKKGDWDTLREAFMGRFGGGCSPEEIWRKLSSLQQTSPLSYLEYEAQFLKLWAEWENTLEQGERAPNFLQKERFLDGLSSPLKEKVKGKFPRTFEEAMQLAQLKDQKLQFQAYLSRTDQPQPQVQNVAHEVPTQVPTTPEDPHLELLQRDLAILLLSAFAIFFALQNEGNVSFKEGWFHFLDDSNPFKHEADRLPPPLVTDLNGDGRKEVLVATHDAEIEVLEPHHKFIDDGFSEARVLAKVSLLPDKVRIAAGRLPVAMAAGSIQRTFRDGDITKQVLVVVTAGWSVICYDHNLNKLWETDLGEEFPTHARHKEVSILITNYTLKHGDMGLIIVGGSVDVQPQLFLDPFEEELMAEKRAERFRHAAEEVQSSEDLPPERSGETARHMHYYAFAGRTGAQHWSHKTEDYHRPSGEAELIPQHNYKLDANSMNSRRKGEVECREFRESILGVMPHRWERREDTKFELAHFRKHKRKVHKKLPGRKSTLGIQKPDDAFKPGKDPGNKLANMISKTASLASNTKLPKELKDEMTVAFWSERSRIDMIAIGA